MQAPQALTAARVLVLLVGHPDLGLLRGAGVGCGRVSERQAAAGTSGSRVGSGSRRCSQRPHAVSQRAWKNRLPALDTSMAVFSASFMRMPSRAAGRRYARGRQVRGGFESRGAAGQQRRVRAARGRTPTQAAIPRPRPPHPRCTAPPAPTPSRPGPAPPPCPRRWQRGPAPPCQTCAAGKCGAGQEAREQVAARQGAGTAAPQRGPCTARPRAQGAPGRSLHWAPPPASAQVQRRLLTARRRT